MGGRNRLEKNCDNWRKKGILLFYLMNIIQRRKWNSMQVFQAFFSVCLFSISLFPDFGLGDRSVRFFFLSIGGLAATLKKSENVRQNKEIFWSFWNNHIFIYIHHFSFEIIHILMRNENRIIKCIWNRKQLKITKINLSINKDKSCMNMKING